MIVAYGSGFVAYRAAVFMYGGVMILIALIGFIVIAEAINQTLEGDN